MRMCDVTSARSTHRPADAVGDVRLTDVHGNVVKGILS
jgi:hypothetical protein